MKLKHRLTYLLAICLAAITWACSGNSAESVEEMLREAEMAVANGDMTAAKSVASHLSDDPNLKSLSATQAARLSMVYMQMAETLDKEDNANTDRATDLYDTAFKINADSASAYYSSVEPEMLQYVETLSARSAHRNNPVDMSRIPDEAAADSLFFQSETDKQ